MTGELYINGVDVSTRGIDMGPGFIDAIRNSISFKEDLENNSMLEHGRRVLLSEKYDSRDVTLTFIVRAKGSYSVSSNDSYLLNLFLGRILTVKIKDDPNYYRLVYTGKNTSYAHTRNVCRRVAKFTEINPNNRGSSSTDSMFTV